MVKDGWPVGVLSIGDMAIERDERSALADISASAPTLTGQGDAMARQPLRDRKVAILLAPAGSEQIEFTEPKKAVQDAGAYVDVIGADPARPAPTTMTLSQARPSPSIRSSTRFPPTTTTP